MSCLPETSYINHDRSFIAVLPCARGNIEWCCAFTVITEAVTLVVATRNHQKWHLRKSWALLEYQVFVYYVHRGSDSAAKTRLDVHRRSFGRSNRRERYIKAFVPSPPTGFVLKTSQIKGALGFMKIMQVTVRSSLKVKKSQVKLDGVLMWKSCGAYFRTVVSPYMYGTMLHICFANVMCMFCVCLAWENATLSICAIKFPRCSLNCPTHLKQFLCTILVVMAPKPQWSWNSSNYNQYCMN